MVANSLEKELTIIHKRMFGFEPSPRLQNQYVEVHSVYQNYIKNEEQLNITRLLEGESDLFSLEFFWRFKNKRNLLSQKFQIIFYLTEVQPEYQQLYISKKHDSFAFFKLAYLTLISVFRLLKGFLIYRKIK